VTALTRVCEHMKGLQYKGIRSFGALANKLQEMGRFHADGLY